MDEVLGVSATEVLRWSAAAGMMLSLCCALVTIAFRPSRVSWWATGYAMASWSVAMARLFMASYDEPLDGWNVLVWTNVALASGVLLAATFAAVERERRARVGRDKMR